MRAKQIYFKGSRTFIFSFSLNSILNFQDCPRANMYDCSRKVATGVLFYFPLCFSTSTSVEAGLYKPAQIELV